MGLLDTLMRPGRAIAPTLDEVVDESPHRAYRIGRRPEVPSAFRPYRLDGETFRQHQIPFERLQEVLPGTRALGISNGEGPLRERRADEIGDDPVVRPVAAADDIAGARAVATAIPRVARKESRYAKDTSSAQALLLE